MTKYNPNDLLTKPVYDIAFYGEDIVIPLGTDTLALQSLTWSGLNELIQVAPANTDTHLESYSRLVSDIDTLGILNEGDGVRFDRTYEWLSDMSAWIYRFGINICAALSVTAFTSGNHSIDSVRFIISTHLSDGTLVKTVADQTIATGMTNIVSVVNAATAIVFEGNTPFKVAQGNVVRLRILFNSTDTLTSTSFEGLMPLYYLQEGSLAKLLIESALVLHVHPALDHAFPVLRDSSVTTGEDFSGITKEGINRACI